jgi:hypothetical protein
MSKIQDIIRSSYSAYKEQFHPSGNQAKAATAIMNCRTDRLGGHKYECEGCGHSIIRYNFCRNRHCPSCQGVNKEMWVDQRKKDILNAPYFHVVFTLPSELHMVIYHNQRLLYDLMYKAVAETLMELSSDPKYLGAQIGFFSVLHTWGQNLHYHPHIHTVVLAGGWTKQNQWRNTSEKFFIPVKVLSKKFRGKFLFYLKQYYREGSLRFYHDMEMYQKPKKFQELIDQCYAINWYSYTKRTFSGPLAVMKYLGRYTHRIAISNQRILSFDKETVKIQVKDYKNNNNLKTVTMKTVEFIRQFLMHVLPKRFMKIRHYGLLANRNRKTKLVRCRKLTKSRTYKPLFEGKSTIEILSILFKKDMTLCSECKKAHVKKAYSWKAAP